MDLRFFSNANKKSFYNEMKKVPKLLKAKQSDDFFKIVMPQIPSIPTTELSNSVLLTLCKTLKNRKVARVFVDGKYIKFLPFNNSELHNQILDLLYILCSVDPDALAPEIAPQFHNLAQLYPDKCLILLEILAEKFENIYDPWDVFEVIISKPFYFANGDIFVDYVNLLIYLNRISENFRKAYFTHAWSAINSILKEANEENTKVCYYGLCSLLDIQPDFASKIIPPIEKVTESLKNEALKKYGMALLLRCPPSKYTEEIQGLVNALFALAKQDRKASLVLIEMAKKESLASCIVAYTRWISEDLPTTLDTTRLFTAVLTHKNLRQKIATATPRVADLFVRMVAIGDPEIVSILLVLTRRMEEQRNLCKALAKAGFMIPFSQLALGCDDATAALAGLAVVSTMATTGVFQRGFADVIGYLVPLMQQEETAKAAGAVAGQLAKFPKLVPVFKANRVDKFMRKRLKDKVLGKYARKVLTCEGFESQ